MDNMNFFGLVGRVMFLIDVKIYLLVFDKRWVLKILRLYNMIIL